MSKLSIAVLAIVALASARPEAEQYTNKFDGIDYRAVVKNDRLFNSYFDCITHGIKCTPAGKELKGKHIHSDLNGDKSNSLFGFS